MKAVDAVRIIEFN